jgi:hypothetical protein
MYRNVFLLAVLCGGCGDDGPSSPVDAAPTTDASPDAPAIAMQMIDRPGGTIVLPGGAVTVSIPADAVDRPTLVTLEVTGQGPLGAYTPIYKLTPDPQVFAHPVTITVTLPSGLADADLYWSNANGAPGFANVGGVIAGGALTAQVVHFGEGYLGPATTTRTVTGAQVIEWMSASAFELVPNDLSAIDVEALLEDGSGGYTTLAGTGHADGTFEIPDVPDGPYWLRIPDRFVNITYVRTSASAVDVGYQTQGRPDAVPLTTPTQVVLDVTNLAPWQIGDRIQMYSTEAFSWYFDAQIVASAGKPAAGATALAGFTLDLAGTEGGPPHVLDASHVPPDRLAVAQLAQRVSSSGLAYTAMSRLLEAPPFSVTPGQTATVTGAFTDVSADATFALDLRADAIRAALAEETRPCTLPASGATWWIYAVGIPGGLGTRVGVNSPDLLAVGLPPTTPDVAADDLAYGVPHTGTWGMLGVGQFMQPCVVTPPGATSAVTVTRGVGMRVMEPLATLGGGPLDVRLSQVRTPTVGGEDLFVAHTGIGTTPTLTWTAPSTGTPTHYTVTVIRVYAAASGSGRSQRVAQLITDQRSITLPPGILTAGESYMFEIGAHTNGRPDISAVNREIVPVYEARVLSAIQQP